jgi:hypothetical protein
LQVVAQLRLKHAYTSINHEIEELEDLLCCPSIFRNSVLYPGDLYLHIWLAVSIAFSSSGKFIHQTVNIDMCTRQVKTLLSKVFIAFSARNQRIICSSCYTHILIQQGFHGLETYTHSNKHEYICRITIFPLIDLKSAVFYSSLIVSFHKVRMQNTATKLTKNPSLFPSEIAVCEVRHHKFIRAPTE